MLERLERILQEAGALLLDRRSRADFTFRRQGVAVQASVDIEAHHCLVRSLSALSPGVPVLSEEDADARRGDRPAEYWLIDPLDGTASFVDGYDGFVTQAALIRGSQLLVAGVHAPALGQMFLAEAGGGATCNGKRILVSARPAVNWILTDNYAEPRGVAADLMQAWQIPNYLECGSIGLKLCRVADGSADIFIKDVRVRDWDVAAPHLVLLEAGGVLTDYSGQPFTYAGDFERNGLVACASGDAARRILDWSKQREKA